MRLRTLKPGFFKNEDLVELSPLARLLFAGLWCLADREGRLEDRPGRIKLELLPGDNCDVNELLAGLEQHGFLKRYQGPTGEHLVQVLNFRKHQTPHIKEPPSTLPAPDVNGTCTVPTPGEPHANRMPAPPVHSVIGELVIGNLEPEVTPNGVVGSAEPSPGDDRVDEVYDHFKARIQPRARLCPRKKIAARLKRFSVAELMAGIDHFAEHPWWMEHNATRGAGWFFESDERAEQFLLLNPPTAHAAHQPDEPNESAVVCPGCGSTSVRHPPGSCPSASQSKPPIVRGEAA